MNKAVFYENRDNNDIRCLLCPHQCLIADGGVGFCKVRKNVSGTLYSLSYGCISSIALDPIEKKPLYQYMPGTRILSIGSYGCNLICGFCQNYEISQEYKKGIFCKVKSYTP